MIIQASLTSYMMNGSSCPISAPSSIEPVNEELLGMQPSCSAAERGSGCDANCIALDELLLPEKKSGWAHSVVLIVR